MTEVERTDPHLQFKRRRLDTAKLITSTIAAVAATAALIVALLVLSSVSVTTRTISDCTTPAGDCYRQQQQRTAEVRDRLADASVAANWCAAHEGRSLDEMQACVTRTLQLLGDK